MSIKAKKRIYGKVIRSIVIYGCEMEINVNKKEALEI